MISCMARKSVLVTGAGGFIGAHLSKALVEHGARVQALVREQTDTTRLSGLNVNCEIVNADLRNFAHVKQVIARVRPQYVFHLATARGTADSQSLIETNVIALLNLLEEAGRYDLERFICFTSSLEHSRSDVLHEEGRAPDPVNLFGATKAAGSLLARQAAVEHDFPLTILKPFHVFGPFEPADRFVPRALDAAVSGAPIPLTAAPAFRDYIYVGDVVRAALMAASSKTAQGQEYNIASGNPASNHDVVNHIERLLGRKLQRDIGAHCEKLVKPPPSRVQISKAWQSFGWKPEYELQDGLRETLEWFRQTGYGKGSDCVRIDLRK